MTRARTHANCLASVQAPPTTADSIVRIVSGMSKVETLRLMARIANDEKFADSTYVFTERLDGAVADLLEEAEAEAEPQPDWREDRADRQYFERVAA